MKLCCWLLVAGASLLALACSGDAKPTAAPAFVADLDTTVVATPTVAPTYIPTPTPTPTTSPTETPSPTVEATHERAAVPTATATGSQVAISETVVTVTLTPIPTPTATPSSKPVATPTIHAASSVTPTSTPCPTPVSTPTTHAGPDSTSEVESDASPGVGERIVVEKVVVIEFGVIPTAAPSSEPVSTVTPDAAPTVTSTTSPLSDRAALVALYHSTDGDNWTDNSNWLSDRPLDEWHGVDIDSDGRVTGLALVENRLIGEIPAEIGKLSNLLKLDLARNGLSGGIPPEIGDLSDLQHLDLELNPLTGEIPSGVVNLSNLRHLDLSGFFLIGEIPSEIGDLYNLRYLDLNGNDLTGEIPSGVNELSNLQHLDLGSNEFVGEIPSGIGDLSNLQHLDLGWNGLSGDLPSGIGDLSNLFELNLVYNRLSGEIPSEIGDLSELQRLILIGNSLSGEIPPEIGSLANLTMLQLAENRLSGEIPSEIANLPRLSRLILRDNQLDGEIPSGIVDLDNLQRLDLGSNQLTGEIPPGIGDLSDVRYLNLGSNQLTGEIPSGIVELYNLQQLDLGSNQLTGEIPSGIVELYNLQRLDLGFNQLTGEIPSEIGDLSNLQDIDLGWNDLTGEIPSEIVDLSDLQRLFFGSNQLTGEIPSRIGDLSNLHYLHLYSNQLTGSIPREIGDLSKIGSISLGNNQLTGSIPREIGDLSNLWSLHLDSNQLRGEIPSEIGNLINLQYLNLADNLLTGEIPEEIGGLANLEQLYLGSNELAGEIPPEIGDLDNLEHLDLSSNELAGELPSEIGDLSNLRQLYLGANLLTGRIPSEIGDLSKLWSLDLGSNQLAGEIPPEIGDLSSLGSLVLADNLTLTGPLPRSLIRLEFFKSISFGGTDLCAPTDNQFQAWLDRVQAGEGGMDCALLVASDQAISSDTILAREHIRRVTSDVEFFSKAVNTVNEASSFWKPENLDDGSASLVMNYLVGTLIGVAESYIEHGVVVDIAFDDGSRGADNANEFVRRRGIASLRSINPKSGEGCVPVSLLTELARVEGVSSISGQLSGTDSREPEGCEYWPTSVGRLGDEHGLRRDLDSEIGWALTSGPAGPAMPDRSSTTDFIRMIDRRTELSRELTALVEEARPYWSFGNVHGDGETMWANYLTGLLHGAARTDLDYEITANVRIDPNWTTSEYVMRLIDERRTVPDEEDGKGIEQALAESGIGTATNLGESGGKLCVPVSALAALAQHAGVRSLDVEKFELDSIVASIFFGTDSQEDETGCGLIGFLVSSYESNAITEEIAVPEDVGDIVRSSRPYRLHARLNESAQLVYDGFLTDLLHGETFSDANRLVAVEARMSEEGPNRGSLEKFMGEHDMKPIDEHDDRGGLVCTPVFLIPEMAEIRGMMHISAAGLTPVPSDAENCGDAEWTEDVDFGARVERHRFSDTAPVSVWSPWKDLTSYGTLSESVRITSASWGRPTILNDAIFKLSWYLGSLLRGERIHNHAIPVRVGLSFEDSSRVGFDHFLQYDEVEALKPLSDNIALLCLPLRKLTELADVPGVENVEQIDYLEILEMDSTDARLCEAGILPSFRRSLQDSD